MSNPSGFILSHPEIPSNFMMDVSDYDFFWHDSKMPEELKGRDPCLWTNEETNETNRQCEEWMALYKQWSREHAGDHKY